MSVASMVRVEQAALLYTLRRNTGYSLTIDAIAEQMNFGRAQGVAPITPLDVECTLAALMLRPDLKGLIAVTTRTASNDERFQRLGLGHAALASTVLLAACATPLSPVPTEHALPSYFGGHGTAQRQSVDFSSGQPSAYAATVIDCGGYLCAARPRFDTSLLTAKTFAVPDAALAASSYFDGTDWPRSDVDEPRTSFASLSSIAPAPRLEAALWSPPPSESVPPLDEPPAQVLAQTASIAPGFTLDFQSPVPSSADLMVDTVFRGSALGARTLPTLSFVSSSPDLAFPTIDTSELDRAPTLTQPAVSSSDSPTVPAFIDGYPAETTHYLVTFRNGSRLLTEQAKAQALSIARTLDPSDKIELRGRVGKRSISSEDAKLAVARAIAVRQQLVELGFTDKNIRIRMPKPADLLDTKTFDSPVNMSVSVFRIPDASSVAATKSKPVSG